MAVSITGVTGTLEHGATLTISGSGFGTKATAAPYVWDDCSGTDPLDKWDWAWPNTNDSMYRLTYRTPAQVTRTSGGTGVSLPHARASKYLAGAHYNSGTIDATSGWDVCVGKNAQQSYEYTYVSHWQCIDPNWVHGGGIGDHNYKEYNYAAGNGYMGDGPNIYFDNKYIDNSTVQWGVNYVEGMNCTIHSVNTDLVEWYPETGMVFPKVSVPGPKQGWRKVEYVLRHNSASGFHRIYQNNQPVWEVYMDDDGGVSPSSRAETPVGGYAVENSSANNWRYISDVYYDHSLSRVMIGNASAYSACTGVEPQPPTAWSDTEITVVLNQAAISSISGSYLYVFDASGVPNASGYALSGVTSSQILFGVRR